MLRIRERRIFYSALIPLVLLAAILTAGVALAQSPAGTGRVAGGGQTRIGGLFTETPTATEPSGSNTPTATTTPGPCDIVINGSITSTDPQQTDRLTRNGVVSSCGTAKTCPGTISAGGLSYDAYTFTNNTASAVCVTVRLDDLGCGNSDLFSAAYLGTYNPNNLCANYLADMGGSPPGIGSYSFDVPAGASFVVVVHEVYSGLGCALYNLRISGLACPTTGTPTGTPTVTATPGSPTATATPCPLNFSDVHSTDYFYEAVQYLYCHGAISGYADNTFRPYNNTTRGQLSKIVVLAQGWAINTTGGPHFSDVPADNPFYSYIETAFNHSVISGYADGTFRWGNNVTRGQLSKIVVTAQGWAIDTSGGPHFSDVPPTSTFYTFIETAYNHGIISGYADNTFRPGNNATRGQISKIVYNAVTGP